MAFYNNRKPKYTAAEKKAYHTGMGYRFADEERAINFSNPKNKASFNNGYRAAGDKIAKNPDRYGLNKRALAKQAKAEKRKAAKSKKG